MTPNRPALDLVKPPNLTVKHLAKLMLAQPHEIERLLQEWAFPQLAGGRKPHAPVPYYGPVRNALIDAIRLGEEGPLVNARVKNNAEGEAELAKGDDSSEAILTRCGHRDRALQDLLGSRYLRADALVRRGRKTTIRSAGVEVRATPDLVLPGECQPVDHRFVYAWFGGPPLDRQEARLTLELAHWVAAEASSVEFSMRQFEYWLVNEGEVVKPRKRRVRTATRAAKVLSIVATLWSSLKPPVGRQARSSDRPTSA